jgi:conjugal transfer pilus assembly protein TraF
MRSLLLILTLIATSGWSDDLFDQDKTIGWFWYKDRQELPPLITTSKLTDLVAQIDFEKEELDRVLKVAIKAPTEQNLINFIKLRNKIIDQSYNFSIRLQQANLMHPELDQLKTYPVNQVAKQIYKTEKIANIEQKIAALSKTHGLFYIFSSNCAYCHAFAPTVKNFANKYGWSLIPISLDGIPNADFPEARNDNGIARKLNIRAIPTLIMVEPKTYKIMPIATGIISEEEIIERIELLIREIKL